MSARAEDWPGTVEISRAREHGSTSKPRLSGVIIASALVTLDGTATTIALPAAARALSASVAHMQWIANAPLLVLAAMLLPAGALTDGVGRVRTIRAGLLIFAAASIACALAPSVSVLVAAKFGQGLGGALVLPAALAALRDAERDAGERTRLFGMWAAWTGAASAAGPLVAGALVDVASWRAVFLPSTVVAAAGLLLLPRKGQLEAATRPGRLPILAAAAMMALLGGVAYLLIEGPRGDLSATQLGLPLALAAAGALALALDPGRRHLFPRELLTARNCVGANATTFALYFGLFGLSFLLVLYVQQVLNTSALWSAVVLLPMSIALLFAERFGSLATIFGTRPLVISGTLAASAGLAWIAASPHPVPFWSHMVVGTGLFGLGVSIAVSTLTNAAVAAVPAGCAGAASALNHAVVRAAGLIAVALLGTVATPGAGDAISAGGFRRAMFLCTSIVAVIGLGATLVLRDRAPGGVPAEGTTGG